MKYLSALLILSLISCSFLYGQSSQQDTIATSDYLLLKIDDLLEQEVVTVSKQKEETNKAPSIVSYVTENEIAQFGANNLWEILDRLTSIYALGSFVFPQNTLAIRGDIASHVNPHFLILIDGRPFRDTNLGGLNASILTSFPTNMIQKIELVRGPGSVLYGTNAFSGVINVITKTEFQDTINASVMGGSFGTYQANIRANLNKDDLQLGAYLQAKKSEGWDFEASLNGTDVFSNQFGEENWSGGLFLNYKGFSMRHFSGKSTLNDFAFSDLTPGAYTFNRGFSDIGYTTHLTENWKISSNITYNRMRDSFISEGGQDLTTEMDDGVVELNNYITISEPLHLLVGGLIHSINGKRTSKDEISLGPYSTFWYSGYFQLKYNPIPQLQFTLGGQINKVTHVDLEFVPRVGLTYNFNKNIGVKLLYGQAFRSAFRSETDLVLRPIIKGNADLKPEKIQTYDIQLFYSGTRGNIALTYYNSKEKNLITRIPFDGDEFRLQYGNVGKLDLQGIELEGKLVVNELIYVTGNVSYQSNQNENGNNISLMPNTMFKTGVGYDLDKKISLGVYLSHFSKAYSPRNALAINPNPESFTNLTANIKIDFSKILQLKTPELFLLNIYVNNALNQDIYYPEIVSGAVNTIPGRAGTGVFLKLNVGF